MRFGKLSFENNMPTTPLSTPRAGTYPSTCPTVISSRYSEPASLLDREYSAAQNTNKQEFVYKDILLSMDTGTRDKAFQLFMSALKDSEELHFRSIRVLQAEVQKMHKTFEELKQSFSSTVSLLDNRIRKYRFISSRLQH